jgi:hypothetical protein
MRRPGGIEERLVGLFLIGVVGFTPPVLSLFSVGIFVAGVPLFYLYLFGLWIALVALAAMVVARLPDEAGEDGPSDAAPGAKAARGTDGP